MINEEEDYGARVKPSQGANAALMGNGVNAGQE